MPKLLIVYFSHGGNTRRMAEAVAEAAGQAGAEVALQKVDETQIDDLAACDGLILGSPCYFANMATPIKELIDQSIKHFGKGELVGKVGGAFCSAGGIGGGGEITLQSIITSLMVHGMVVQGVRKGAHLGPLAIGAPDDAVLEQCRAYGRQVAQLLGRLAG